MEKKKFKEKNFEFFLIFFSLELNVKGPSKLIFPHLIFFPIKIHGIWVSESVEETPLYKFFFHLPPLQNRAELAGSTQILLIKREHREQVKVQFTSDSYEFFIPH